VSAFFFLLNDSGSISAAQQWSPRRGQRSRPFYFLLVDAALGVFALRQQANNNKIIAADCGE
jgi:hypothetical protein